ncbi:MAG: DUF116 domain-containing protein, partial [Methanoregulaceae archaeon]|nr:DUF116 domain-containing protein [Methanoregulaceae archaeon]
MAIENSIISQFIFLIGEITLLFILGSIIFAILMVTLALISIRRGKIYFPSLIKSGMVLVEGLMKALFRLFGLEDQQIHTFFI